MRFKSDTQPLCKGCGKPIAKHTTSVYFGAGPNMRDSDYATYRPEFPRTREEAQRLVNMQVVSISWRRRMTDNSFARTVGQPDFDYIDRVSVWDGETYIDEHFHAQQCAVLLGRAMAAKGWAMQPYRDAEAARGV